MSRLRIHIGHHFFGAGNVGDDLMLAGFLQAAGTIWLRDTTLTCCTAHDRHSQELRFPEIEWLPCDLARRETCIARADAWLGLGDTPFQAMSGNAWFLDHLEQEAALCRRYDVPMYYLGVGVDESAAAAHPQVEALVRQAERLWMRDETSAALLAPLAPPGKVTAHADLAHLALAPMTFTAPQADTMGFVLNFEDATQYRVDRLAALIEGGSNWRVRWLAQEARALPGSERSLYDQLPPGVRARARLHRPDYAFAGTPRQLLRGWEGIGRMLVSRYHAALIGAWMGAAVGVFPRNDKVAGGARQLGLATVPSLDDPAAVLAQLEALTPADRGILRGLAVQAGEACASFFATMTPPTPANLRASGGAAVSNPAPPRRVLLLRPDAYGDLTLFEPVARILRNIWPDTEVAILIRERCRDIIPVLGSEGIQWLTTTCDPYRSLPEDSSREIEALRLTLTTFAPDCLVAACTEQTWLEAAAAQMLHGVRQVSSGGPVRDPRMRASLEAVMPVDWAGIFAERIGFDPELSEWEKNIRLVSALTGVDAPPWWPVARVPEDARGRATQILARRGLAPGVYVACAAAGMANVQIKNWPAAKYGPVLAWLEREHGLRALLVGHEAERESVETVCESARQAGGNPAVWLGEDGEMPVLTALLDASRLYFGNETGALHLAAALGRPLVGIFGGGYWPRFRPVAVRAVSVVQTLPCFGCGWDCLYADAPCLRTIAPASVYEALTRVLAAGPDGNTVLDASGLEPETRQLIETATPQLRLRQTDRANRMRQVYDLTSQVRELSERLEANDADRQRQIDELGRLLAESETDRAARIGHMERLASLLAESEADRAARLRRNEELSALLAESEADRTVRLRNLDELTALLKESEADRAARLVHMERLTALLAESEARHTDRPKATGTLSQGAPDALDQVAVHADLADVSFDDLPEFSTESSARDRVI